MNSSHGHSPSILHLNVGGQLFCTTVETLTLREPKSMLAMFSGHHDDGKGYIFIDRDAKHFRHILNWLRDGALPIMKYHHYMELLREAEYFRLSGLIDEIKAKALDPELTRKAVDLDPELIRAEVIKFLKVHEKIRLQGVNLSGFDFSGLDPKGANLQGTNLTMEEAMRKSICQSDPFDIFSGTRSSNLQQNPVRQSDQFHDPFSLFG